MSEYKPLSLLEKKISYSYKDIEFLNNALTHKSFSAKNNERLEFLGDSILNFVIADYLFSHFEDLREGALSRLRANLVKGETLALVAKDIGLKDYIRLGPGELKSGGFNRSSILADTVEAIIASVYLDSDFDQARIFVLSLYSKYLEDPDLLNVGKDPKTSLQEYLQGKKNGLPVYEIVEVSGESHNQLFTISCFVDGEKTMICTGKSRRKAEQKAAALMLESLK